MYTDLSRPPLDQAALRRALVDGPGATWSALDVVPETGSTNADLVGRVTASADPASTDRAVLIAEHQSRGRGRHARSWSGPPQSQLSLSVVVRAPGVYPAELGWLPLLTGVAVVDALRAVAEVEAGLKWPNDVLIGGRKAAGILAEVAVTSPTPIVVVGLGLNVSLREDELPIPTATSLELAGASCTDRDTLVRAVLRELARRVDQWQGARGAAPDLVADYRERCLTLGMRVRASMPGDLEVVGVAGDIDDEGRLVIEADETVAVSAGDITHLRPADGG